MLTRIFKRLLLPLRYQFWAWATFDDHWTGDWPPDVKAYAEKKWRKK